QQEQAVRWRVDIESPETAGTLYWNQGDNQGAGSVQARFERLALGGKAGESSSQETRVAEPAQSAEHQQEQLAEVGQEIPAIDLKVEHLTLFGSSVGKLSVQGVSEQQGRFWRLNQLALSAPSASLSGSGIWRLADPQQRGLTL